MLSHFQSLLERGDFVVTGEVGPPHGTDHSLVTERVRVVMDHCDAVNITDNVRGIPTMSSMVCAHFVLRAGAEPIMQMSTRDRNRVLFQSDLYGAYALGVRNVMFVTGDHTLLGTHPQTKMVYDIDSVQALQIASHLMTGRDLAGTELEGTPQLFIGATFNPYADPMEVQAWRVEKKQSAGARFFQTQAIYDTDRFRDFMGLIEGIDASVLAGIIPLKSAKMARFMNDRIPGIKIPSEVIERLECSGDGLHGDEKREAMKRTGITIALETIREVRSVKGVNGIHIMGVGWEDCIPELVRGSGLYPRPVRGE
ncbi:MAG: methylenetetrahydrofolate reductase [Candidatus Thorarchaeota archaeon]|nr:methylenetetrahydrofolate reductase [Candidatus Thorarchaeota archaeon]